MEKLVADNFEEILNNTFSSDWHYFKMYPEWEKLFIENKTFVFESLDDIYDFEKLIDEFPSLEKDVYDYLFGACILRKEPEFYGVIDIAADILQPMAYLEKYRGYYFPQIRICLEEILSATPSSYFAEFYNTITILEYEFDIPEEKLNPYFEKLISSTIERWTNEPFYPYNSVSEELISFFCDARAYDAFMKNLSKILQINGLRIYSDLIKYIGPIYEIMEKEFDCNEFNNN